MRESQLTSRLIHRFISLLVLLLFLFFAASCSTLSDRPILSDAYYNLGNSELDKGNNQEAEKYFITAFIYNPDSRSVSYNLAITYTLNGKFTDAENLLQQLLEEDPDNVIIRNAYAWNMYKRGEFSKAIELYESVLINDPAYDDLRINCIRVCLEIGDFDRASFHIDFLMRNSTLNSEILFLKGELSSLQNDSKAEDWYIASLNKDSGNEEASAGLMKILHTKTTGKLVRVFYEKLGDAGVLTPEFIYELSLHLLALEESSGFDYFKEAVLSGFDISQVKKSDVSSLSDSIKTEFIKLLGEAFINTFQ